MLVVIGILLILISLFIFGDYSSFKNTGSPDRLIYYNSEFGPYVVLFCLILLVSGIVLFFL